MDFNANSISQYRKTLMGISTLMILICHSNIHKVALPASLSLLFNYGNLGVDIFLFLSGMGIWYSLDSWKDDDKPLIKWYSKRYRRILIPYTLLAVPFLFFKGIEEDETILSLVGEYTTINYWITGTSLWFLALLFILYLIAPLLQTLLDRCNKYKGLTSAVIIIFIMLLTNNHFVDNLDKNDFVYNCQFAFKRAPGFILGFVLASSIKNKVSMNVFLLLGITLTSSFLVVFLLPSVDRAFPMGMTSLLVLSIILVKFHPKTIITILNFLGDISLESYLTNTYVGYSCRHFIPWDSLFGSWNNGHYLEYATVIIVGLFLAIIVHLITKRINNIINGRHLVK